MREENGRAARAGAEAGAGSQCLMGTEVLPGGPGALELGGGEG